MGNSLGGKRYTKIMKINGETIKLKTPVVAGDIVKDYPGHVLLESEAVKHFGIRAKPLGLHQELKGKRLYFLVELPKYPPEKAARRVRSGINMSAKDRLESLMLARRSVSDLSLLKPPSMVVEESSSGQLEQGGDQMRVRMRLPKAEVERLMKESKDDAEVAERIVQLCMANNGGGGGGSGAPTQSKQHVHWEQGGRDGVREGFKAQEKRRVCFLPITEGEIQVAVA